MKLRDALEEFSERRLVDVKGGETLIRSINLFLNDTERLNVNSSFNEITTVLESIQDDKKEMLLDLHVELNKGSTYSGVAFLVAVSMFFIALFLAAVLAIENPMASEATKEQVVETLTAIFELLMK